LTLRLPRSIPARKQLNPYLQGAQGKEVEQWQSGADHNVRLNKGSVKPSTNLMQEQYKELLKLKKASPLPLPRSRSRDSQLQQIETNANATTAQPTTIPSSGRESNEVRRRSAQVHPIRGNMGHATAPIRRSTTNPIPTRTPFSKL